mgnify:CR=1 FL=1
MITKLCAATVHSINTSPLPNCPHCTDVPETVQTLFSCPHNLTHLTPLGLWTENLQHCTLVQIPDFLPTSLFQPFVGRFWCPIRQIGGFRGQAVHFWKKNIWPQRSKTFKVTFKVWKSQIYACPASLCTFSASKIKCPSNQNVLTYQRSPFDLWNLQYDL